MSNMTTTNCEGMWQRWATIEDDSDGITVNRCTGCDDWLVIIGYSGYDVRGADASTAEAAARVAMAERAATRRIEAVR